MSCKSKKTRTTTLHTSMHTEATTRRMSNTEQAQVVHAKSSNTYISNTENLLTCAGAALLIDSFDCAVE